MVHRGLMIYIPTDSCCHGYAPDLAKTHYFINYYKSISEHSSAYV